MKAVSASSTGAHFLPLLRPHRLLLCLSLFFLYASSNVEGACPNLLSIVYVSSSGASTGVAVPVTGLCGCGSKASPCGSLLAGIKNVQSGGRILLSRGIHVINSPTGLDIGGRSVTIEAELAASIPTVDCSSGPCIHASNVTCKAVKGGTTCSSFLLSLKGFKIQNGYSATGDGGCLLVENHALELKNMHVDSCAAANLGGAISLYQLPMLTISMTSITNGMALNPYPSSSGGCMDVHEVTNAQIDSLTMNNCFANASVAGAINFYRSEVAIANSQFSQCASQLFGGCFIVDTSSVMMINVTMGYAQSEVGGCIAGFNASLSVYNSAFSDCKANSLSPSLVSGNLPNGGAIYVYDTYSYVTIFNSTFSDNIAYYSGGAIHAELVGLIQINDTTIEHNSAAQSQGGGLSVIGGPFMMFRCKVRSNSVFAQVSYGGGVFVDSNPVIISDTVLFDNNAALMSSGQASGGGIFQGNSYYPGYYQPSLQIENSKFINNQASRQGGGGIYVTNTLQMVNTLLSNNSGSEGGGVYFLGPGMVSNCTFDGNFAISGGAAILNYDAVPGSYPATSFTDTIFINNQAADQNGGALSLPSRHASEVSVDNCTFLYNMANPSSGGAIFHGGAKLTITNSKFNGNLAFTKGGAIAEYGSTSPSFLTKLFIYGSVLENNTAGLGGGGMYVTQKGFATVESTVVRNNSAQEGAGILADEYGTLSMGKGSTCSGNQALGAGGCASFIDYSSASLSNSFFGRNEGGGEGGAIRASGLSSLQLRRSTLAKNSAGGGGGIWGEMYAQMTISGTKFKANKAKYQGGAIYATHGSSLTLGSSAFTLNKGLTGGALLTEGDSTVSIVGSIFKENSLRGIMVRGKSSADISRSSIVNNSAGLIEGGGIFMTDASSVRITECQLAGNRAAKGGALYSGAHAYVTVTFSNFSTNQAISSGGGGFLEGSCKFSFSFCRFVENNASAYGAGLALEAETSGNLTSSLFLSNKAGQDGAGVYISRDPSTAQNESRATELAQNSTKSLPSSPALSQTFRLNVSNLTFTENKGKLSQGAAYFEASYYPAVRSNCTACVQDGKQQTVGSVPYSMVIVWSDDIVIPSSPVQAPLTLLGDKQAPVSNLSVYLFDDTGQLAIEDLSSIVRVLPDEKIAGLLQGSTLNGVVTLPDILYVATTDQSVNNFSLTIAAYSPLGAYPTIQTLLNFSFCPAGYFVQDKQCVPCVLGSWCEPGQGAVFCPVGTYSLFTGSVSQDNCTACPAVGVTCAGDGLFVVSAGYWLDPDSVQQNSPVAYACDLTNGCQGFNYTGNDQQCSDQYDQNRICSACSKGYFLVLRDCEKCTSLIKSLFPLFIILMFAFFLTTALSSTSFHSLSILFTELQIISLIGSLNVLLPDWMLVLVKVSSITLFSPDVLGVDCHVAFNFNERWWFSVTLVFAGFVVYTLIYFGYKVLRVVNQARKIIMAVQLGSIRAKTFRAQTNRTQSGRSMAKTDSGRSEPIPKANSEDQADKEGKPKNIFLKVRQLMGEVRFEDQFFHGWANWMDLTYIIVTMRVFEAFHAYYYGRDVLGWGPEVGWMSALHIPMFVVSVFLCVFIVIGFPLSHAYLMAKAKKKKMKNTKRFRVQWGWMVSRYDYKYHWWYATSLARRVVVCAIWVFWNANTPLQISSLGILQIVRIIIEFFTSPFALKSIDLLTSMLQLAEFLYVLGVVSMMYLGLGEELFQTVFVISLILYFVPASVTFVYEFLSRALRHSVKKLVNEIWRNALESGGQLDGTINSDLTSHAEGGTSEDIVSAADVALWFRPEIIFPMLLHPEHHRLLLQVRQRFEACKHRGFGDTRWMKHLNKSQLFAVVSQTILGVKAGKMRVVTVPLKEDGTPGVSALRGGPRSIRHLADPDSMLSQVTMDKEAEEIWPPHFPNELAWTEEEPLNKHRSEVDDEEDADSTILAAHLDSTDLGLVFNTTFGMLIKTEKKFGKGSLRTMIQSDNTPNILAWLSADTCTMEDRELFVSLVTCVRDMCINDTGSLKWLAGMTYYTRWRLGMVEASAKAQQMGTAHDPETASSYREEVEV